jgi:hypothetical protein
MLPLELWPVIQSQKLMEGRLVALRRQAELPHSTPSRAGIGALG